MPDKRSTHWKVTAICLALGSSIDFYFLPDRTSVYISAVILCLPGTLQIRSVI